MDAMSANGVMVQAAGAVLLLVNSGLLLRITYAAGRLMQTVEEHERRIVRIEDGHVLGKAAAHGR